MIVVDTNVVSEPLRARPDPVVIDWLATTGPNVAITAVTVQELLYGVQRLPRGRRRSGLMEAIDRMIRSAGDRILAYDEAAARTHASLRAIRDKAGRPSSLEDGMIAAIAHTHRAKVATRNVSDFEGFGIEIVNPWGSTR